MRHELQFAALLLTGIFAIGAAAPLRLPAQIYTQPQSAPPEPPRAKPEKRQHSNLEWLWQYSPSQRQPNGTENALIQDPHFVPFLQQFLIAPQTFWGTSINGRYRSLANTANDPSYPGAHAEFSQAAAAVLETFFGTDAFSFSLSNPSVNITRTFTSFSQAANEASESRIFAGQHFQYDQNAGQAQGSQVAAFVLDHAFAPLGNRGHDHNHG